MTTPHTQAALAALAQNRADEALRVLRAAGPQVADDPIALQIWSVALSHDDDRAVSLALLDRAARLAPSDAQTHFNFAVGLQQANDLPAAIARYEHALRLAPDHLGALNNLSDLLRRRGRGVEGYRLMQRFLAAGGPANGMELRLAKLALEMRRWDEAKDWFLAAAKSKPDDPMVAFEHAMLALLQQDWRQGWPLYEARLRLYGGAGLAMAEYALSAWDGASPGQILIHREQGLGDAIMFAAAVPEMAASGYGLHLAQAPSLQRLFEASFPSAKVWSSVTVAGGPQPQQPFLRVCGKVDAQAPICSLGALRMAAGPPPPQAYLRAPPAIAAVWRERLDALAPARAGRRRVGLCCVARRPTFDTDGAMNGALKSIPVADLAPLAAVSNVQWVSLHDSGSAAVLADVADLDIVDVSPWITDFADTAAIIAQLDLVLTVDTAVAHLAGALGAPTWLLLRHQADWRWGVDRNDAAWYPHIRVFRQSRAGDWAGVLEAVARALG